MSASKLSAFILFLIISFSLVSHSYSTSRLDSSTKLGRKLSETKVSSMFVQSYSAILSSLKSIKLKKNYGINRLVPTGPNPIHN
ncbi:hypothetical protein PHAVU_007G068500 [Phaseolus vulgaris]|uniref:Clavata3/ESR (CLE) gene family member n=1 Tax=Phaseolus vulgaris TaxID=3885 RepID=V7BER0_PHAVU|nr:hypothetical protein PHAVU_007G068500g [Phaseolus vulgaris]ESW15383.1 hypothetical protein PHAVU_007G068500g [Phaseolus vulgaris]